MEDLKVHDNRPEVSEESSAATLGAMLPTVPPEKEILKKEGMIGMIPNELMDFIYSEDAQYTYAVEGAIDNLAHNIKDKFSNTEHGKDLAVTSLPFKVRKLTIERATLRVKISWMGKRKSKQEKVAKYKKRLVEVEQALRKIQNSVQSADEKARLAKQIKDLDEEVTREQKTQVERRALTESVNAMISEGQAAGYILSDMREFTVDEFCPMDDGYGFDAMFEAGANTKLTKAFVKSRAAFATHMTKARISLAKKEYKTTIEHIGKAKKALKDMSAALDKYPQTGLTANVCGTAVGGIVNLFDQFVKTLGYTAVISAGNKAIKVDGEPLLSDADVVEIGKAMAKVHMGAEGWKRLKNNLKDDRCPGKTPTTANDYYNRMLTFLKDAEKTLDKFEEKTYKKMQKSKNPVDKASGVVHGAAKSATDMKKTMDSIGRASARIFESVDLEIEACECTEEDLEFLEGANMELVDILVSAKLRSRTALKRAKKAVKKGKPDVAADEIKKVKEEVAHVGKALKEYPKDSITTNALGMLIGWLIYDITYIIEGFAIKVGTIAAGGVAAGISGAVSKNAYVAIGAGSVAGGGIALTSTIVVTLTNLVGVLRRFKANLDDKRKKKRNLDFTFVNGTYNRCLVYLKDTEKALDKLEKELRKAKETKKGKVTKESVTEEIIESTSLQLITDLVGYFESGLMEEDSFLDLMLEARKPDDGMMDILSTLHNKGYKTKYSCSGHKDSGKHDRNDDGIVNGKLTSAARIMFGSDYDFPDPPKHWGFKTVDGKDYLYVLPYSSDSSDPKAFDAWKNRYISSLKRWVDALPNAKESKSEVVEEPKNDDKKDAEKDVKESVEIEPMDIDAMMEDEYATLMMDVNDFF